MNKAAKVITGDLLGINAEAFVVGGKQYVAYPPNIKTLSKAIYHLSDVEFSGDDIGSIIKEIPNNADGILKGLSCFICGDEHLKEELSKGTFEEMRKALDCCMRLIDTEVFQCAARTKAIAQIAGTPKQ